MLHIWKLLIPSIVNQGSLEEQKLYNDYILIEDLLYEIRHVHSHMAIGNQDL